jgi:hypothetical protein
MGNGLSEPAKSLTLVEARSTAPAATSKVMLLLRERAPVTQMRPADTTTLQPKADVEPFEQRSMAAWMTAVSAVLLSHLAPNAVTLIV